MLNTKDWRETTSKETLKGQPRRKELKKTTQKTENTGESEVLEIK